MLKKTNMKIHKDDQVEVTAGDEKGKRGRVLRVFPTSQRVIVEGVNFIWKHLKRSQQHPQGGRLEKEAPVHVSKVMLVSSSSGKPTRVKMVERKEKRDNGRSVSFRYRVGKDGAPVSAKDKTYAETKG